MKNKSKTIGLMLAGELDYELEPIIDHFQIEEWIAVDGGYDHLKHNGITPEIIIGDFDSTSSTFSNELRYNPIKDDTDFALAIAYVEQNYNHPQIIVCAPHANVRIEHFIANLKLMTNNMTFVLKSNLIQQLAAGKHTVEPQGELFSLFAKNTVTNLTIKAAKWELTNYLLDVNDPLTISNEFIGKKVEISFDSGIIQLYLENNI